MDRPLIIPGFGKTALFCLSMLFFTPHPALAAEQDLVTRLKNCKSITSIVLRSKCYDETVDEYNMETLEKKTLGAGSVGKWQATFEKSPLKDVQNVYLSLIGNEYFTNKNGKFTRPSLVLRCAEGVTDAYVIWDSDLGPNDPLVNLRIGNQPVIPGHAKRSGDNQASFIPNPQDVIQKMLTESVFYIKVWPSEFDPIDSSFDIRGLNVAIDPLRKACNW